MERIDHIAFVIPNPQSVQLWEKILAQKPYYEEVLESQGVKVYSFQIGAVRIELMEPLSEVTADRQTLISGSAGVHHLAFYTENISEHVQRLREIGFEPLMDSPVPTGMGQEGVLLRGADGLLIELVRFS
ncbi:MAG: VOC family protein [Bacteroidia bacterium]|nr:VOC family protein [Bacteroidia bacterium]MCX7651416.1 VOC family protein [Bacteroidia bacterium]MDW8417051.1 VOC family protein [Bacteroidia bacterium]